MTKLLISGFPTDITERQIEDLFIKEGRIVFSDINVAKGQGKLEYDDPKSASKAIEALNGSTQFGSKITVELSNSDPFQYSKSSHFKRYRHASYSRSRSYSSSRSYSRGRRHYRSSRKLPTSRDKCYVCGKYGHWASQCKEGDGTGVSSGKCFKCGEKGHIARNCPNTRKKSSFHSFSRSDSRSESYQSSARSRHKRRRKRTSPSESSKSRSSRASSASSSSNSRRRDKKSK